MKEGAPLQPGTVNGTSDAAPPRRWFVRGIALLLVVAIAVVVWVRPWQHESARVLEVSTVVPDAVTTDVQASSTSEPRDRATLVTRLDDDVAVAYRFPVGWSGTAFSMDETRTEDAFQQGLWGFALSEDEAHWMDRQGISAPSQLDSLRHNMDLRELLRRARAGDLMAMRIGSQKARSALWWQGVGTRIRQLVLPPLAPGQSYKPPAEADRQQLEPLMEQLFQTPEWDLYREFLWQGVLHGSSYAAAQMRDVYTDPMGACYKPYVCQAWQLVAWRMGNWDVTPAGRMSLKYAALESRGVSSHAFARANVLWIQINDARAERGLPPLQIDLRPNADAWQAWRGQPDEAKRIYRR